MGQACFFSRVEYYLGGFEIRWETTLILDKFVRCSNEGEMEEHGFRMDVRMYRDLIVLRAWMPVILKPQMA